ncbi:MAG: DUF1846 domain-containing protein [Clostridia bacterium]|nr:DUF1846 domain-containing protein [Clostridia bacterium]MBQ7789522.1 DUF1846 domain-containing protein [Clostridia bacterium]
MYRIGFDNNKYLKLQSEKIKERIAKFGGKLYLEFGGKLFDDHHASRVLPGFEPDSKIRMLTELKDQAEVIIAVNSHDIEKNKVRGDLGITYDLDVLRLIDAFRGFGLYVGSVVLTRYDSTSSVEAFKNKLEALGIKVYKHYAIKNYPYDIDYVVSDEGYGKNDYIETERSLVVVTAPGPGSGKMATCLSQIYHDHKRGVNAGYAKFETFPIWNIPLSHPVNAAYEAATADLNDINMIDPFHLEAYGTTSVNYNRDVEIFPVLRAMFEGIMGECPYKSPTDMGVNMAGNCIFDDEAVRDAANNEIVRRYYNALCNQRKGNDCENEINKIKLIMKNGGINVLEERPCIKAALDKAESTGAPAAAIELCDGRIVTGKTSALLGASSAVLINAVKTIAGIDDKTDIISPDVLEPVQRLKIENLGNHNPRLHTDEVLIALAITAATSNEAKRAMEALASLKNAQLHSSVILSPVDVATFRKLGIHLTCEPAYQTKKLFHG